MSAVGVTGHRTAGLTAAEPERLRRRVGEVLAAVAGALPGGARLWSALAEGADRIAAEEALALGWELACALPLPRTDYEADFADPTSLHEFRLLLARATGVVELDAVAGSERSAAYQRAGRRILAEADLLLAVWDGEAARGPGGTAEMVAEAGARRMPIVWVNAASPHAVSLWTTGAWRAVEPADLGAALAAEAGA